MMSRYVLGPHTDTQPAEYGLWREITLGIFQDDHSPDNVKFPDGSQHSACKVLLISCPY